MSQFFAVATYADGSNKDVTASVVWRSSDVSVLTISGTGLATALESGDSTITAVLNAAQAMQMVSVVPAGTFRLGGTVRWLGNPLYGASVQVMRGIGAGLTAVTRGDGSYRLFGVAGDIQLMVSKSAYQTIQQSRAVDSNTTLNFDMVTIDPVPQFAGTYTLRITADPACPITGDQALPADARDRRYPATIVQPDLRLVVKLSGPNLTANTLYGMAAFDGTADFDVNDPAYFYAGANLFETLPDRSVYYPEGEMHVKATGADLVGTLDGTIYDHLPPPVNTIAQCGSSHHTVTFTNLGAQAVRTTARR
jgi:hypothetical protein